MNHLFCTSSDYLSNILSFFLWSRPSSTIQIFQSLKYKVSDNVRTIVADESTVLGKTSTEIKTSFGVSAFSFAVSGPWKSPNPEIGARTTFTSFRTVLNTRILIVLDYCTILAHRLTYKRLSAFDHAASQVFVKGAMPL